MAGLCKRERGRSHQRKSSDNLEELFEQSEIDLSHYYTRKICQVIAFAISVVQVLDIILGTYNVPRVITLSGLAVFVITLSVLSKKWISVTRLLLYGVFSLFMISFTFLVPGGNLIYKLMFTYWILVFMWIFVLRNRRLVFPTVVITTTIVNIFQTIKHPEFAEWGSPEKEIFMVASIILFSTLFIFLVSSFASERLKAFIAVQKNERLVKNINSIVEQMPVGLVVCTREKLLHSNRVFKYLFEESLCHELNTQTHSECFHHFHKIIEDEPSDTTLEFLSSVHFEEVDSSNVSESSRDSTYSLGKFKFVPCQGAIPVDSNFENPYYEIKVTKCQWLGEESHLVIFQNITALEEAYVQVKELDALKCRWIRTVSHELRTPLNGVMGVFQLLKNRETEYQNLVQTGTNAAQTLLLYISDLLDYFQIQAGSFKICPKKFKVSESLERVAELIALKCADRKIALEINSNKKDDLVLTNDNNRIEQVLLNLLSNANKFTPDGGKIILKAYKEIDQVVSISVQDTGIGIKPEDMDNLFGEFSRVVNSETIELNPQGNGLGLWISRKMCQAMGGNLTVQSTYGKGSTFIASFRSDFEGFDSRSENTSIELDSKTRKQSERSDSESDVDEGDFQVETKKPHHQLVETHISPFKIANVQASWADSKKLKPDESTTASSRSTRSHGGCCSKTFLIVDDEALNRLVLTSLLNSRHILCDEARDGKEAIEMIVQRSIQYADCECKNYAVIIMDYEMPRMTGPECCQRLTKLIHKGKLDTQKIIGHTAYSSDEDLGEFMSYGILDILPKPVTEENLVRIFEKWFE